MYGNGGVLPRAGASGDASVELSRSRVPELNVPYISFLLQWLLVIVAIAYGILQLGIALFVQNVKPESFHYPNLAVSGTTLYLNVMKVLLDHTNFVVALCCAIHVLMFVVVLMVLAATPQNSFAWASFALLLALCTAFPVLWDSYKKSKLPRAGADIGGDASVELSRPV